MDHGYGRFPAGGARSPSRIPDFPSSRPQYGGSGVSTLERHQRSHSLDTRGELYPTGRYGSGGGGGSARHYYSSGIGNGGGGGRTAHTAREQRATYKSQYQQQPRQYHTDSGRLGRDAFFNDSITLGASGVRGTAALGGGGGIGGTMIPIRRGVAPYHHRSAHAGLDRAGLGEGEGEWTSYDKSVRYNRERTDYPPPPMVRESREEHAKRDFTRESGTSAYGYGGSRGPPPPFQPQAITYPVGVVESDYASRREHEMRQGRNATTGEAAFADYRDSGAATAGQHQSYHHSHHRSRHHHESSGGGRGGWTGGGGQHCEGGRYAAYDGYGQAHEGGRPLVANGGPNYLASGAQQQHQQYNESSRHSSGRQHRTASAGATSGGWYTGGGRNIIGGRTRSKEKQPQQLYQQQQQQQQQYYYQGDKPPPRYHKVRCCCFTMKWPPWAVEPCDPPHPMYAPQWGSQRAYYNRKGYSVPPPQYPVTGGEISHQINIQPATPPLPPSDTQPPPSANIQYQPGLQQYPPPPTQQHLPAYQQKAYHQPQPQPYTAQQYPPHQYPLQQHQQHTEHMLQPSMGGAPRHY